MSKARNEIGPVVKLPEDQSAWAINTPYAFASLAIILEYLAGDTRIKVKSGGRTVENVMPVAYGYILRTNDVHGEEIDVYVNNDPYGKESVFVIDQVCASTGQFDEHKVMLGFASAEECAKTYLKVFGDGSGAKRLGAIVEFPGDSIHAWLSTPGAVLEPASKFGLAAAVTMVNGIAAPRPTANMLPKPLDGTGGVIMELPDMSKGPQIFVKALPNGGREYTLNLIAAIKADVWSNVTDQLVRTLAYATDKDTLHIQIDCPGGSVFIMGRVVSAIRTTKAKVITYAKGCVASAATTIWAAGHERHILKGAYFMQHMSSQNLQGKTSDIAAKSRFCQTYVQKQLQPLVDIGLFTEQEVIDMSEKDSDIYISGRDASARIAAKQIDKA